MYILQDVSVLPQLQNKIKISMADFTIIDLGSGFTEIIDSWKELSLYINHWLLYQILIMINNRKHCLVSVKMENTWFVSTPWLAVTKLKLPPVLLIWKDTNEKSLFTICLWANESLPGLRAGLCRPKTSPNLKVKVSVNWFTYRVYWQFLFQIQSHLFHLVRTQVRFIVRSTTKITSYLREVIC